jgi:hypothetical protein
MYILQQIIRGNAEAGIEFAKLLVLEDGIEVELERVQSLLNVSPPLITW